MHVSVEVAEGRNDVGLQWVSQIEDPSPASLETIGHEQAADGHLHLSVMRHRSCNSSGIRRYDLSVTRRSWIGINDSEKVAGLFVVIPAPGEEIRMILDSDDIQSASKQQANDQQSMAHGCIVQARVSK
jgi:hypothetical protein